MYFSQDDCEHEGTWNEEGKFAGSGVGAAAAEERKE